MLPVRLWRLAREARRATHRCRLARREKKDLIPFWSLVPSRVACFLLSGGGEAARDGVQRRVLDPALARRLRSLRSRYDVQIDMSRGVGTLQSSFRVPTRDLHSGVECSSAPEAAVVGARTGPYRVCTSCHRWCSLGRVCLVWGYRLIVRDGMRKRRTWLRSCTRYWCKFLQVHSTQKQDG